MTVQGSPFGATMIQTCRFAISDHRHSCVQFPRAKFVFGKEDKSEPSYSQPFSHTYLSCEVKVLETKINSIMPSSWLSCRLAKV
jgi:hypothetical protein